MTTKSSCKSDKFLEIASAISYSMYPNYIIGKAKDNNKTEILEKTIDSQMKYIDLCAKHKIPPKSFKGAKTWKTL
jgi:hypothetical protein